MATQNGNGSDESFTIPSGFWTINGRGGNDTATITGFGLSEFNGGTGSDRLVFDYSALNGFGFLTHDFHGGAGLDTIQLNFAGSKGVISDVIGGVKTFISLTDKGLVTISADASVERVVITGSAGTDLLRTGNGNDWIDGGGGVDLMAGGKGDDGYLVYSSDTYVFEAKGEGTDSIWAFSSFDLGNAGEVENLRLKEGGAWDATGNDLDNLITGNAMSNVIEGGAGVDKLYGKGGADTFVFREYGAENKDSIWDYSSDDRIALDHSVFAGLQDLDSDGFLDAAQFQIATKAGAATVGAGAAIIYNSATGVVSYDADGAGGDAAQDIAYIGKKLAFVDAGDFAFV